MKYDLIEVLIFSFRAKRAAKEAKDAQALPAPVSVLSHKL